MNENIFTVGFTTAFAVLILFVGGLTCWGCSPNAFNFIAKLSFIFLLVSCFLIWLSIFIKNGR